MQFPVYLSSTCRHAKAASYPTAADPGSTAYNPRRMTNPYKAIWKSLVRQFYVQNAGFFLFIFLVFFGVVAPSQQPAYHYALIRGILAAPAMLILVLAAWLWYAFKCSRWIIGRLQNGDHIFLRILPSLGKTNPFFLLFRIQVVLY